MKKGIRWIGSLLGVVGLEVTDGRYQDW